jgi:hypothetical protein
LNILKNKLNGVKAVLPPEYEGLDVKISKKNILKISQQNRVLPLSYGERGYTCFRAYLHRHQQPTGLGIRIKNIDGKAVVRGFTLPVEISEETLRAEENRQAVRSALQAHAQSQVHPESYAAHKLNTSFRLMTYPGTGIRVDTRVTDEVHPFNNPAYKAGVRLNDVIMSVNNIDARTSTFEVLIYI